MTEVDPRLKFQLPTVYVNPNVCIGCGKTDNGNVLDPAPSPGMADLARDIDWYGAVYLCSDCAYQIARIFGAISPQEYEGMQRELTEALADSSELRRENLALKKVVDGYRDYGELVSGRFSATVAVSMEDASSDTEPISGPSEPERVEESQEVTESPSSTEQPVGDSVHEELSGGEGPGSPEINEPVNLGGHSDVRDDSSNDELSKALGLS